jgi:hypothetical protein
MNEARTSSELFIVDNMALVSAHPELAALASLPLKVFSDRASPKPAARAVFFCYRIPRPDPNLIAAEKGQPCWSDSAGFTVWLCYDLAGQRVLSEPVAIAALIHCEPNTPRRCIIERTTLAELRRKVEKQVINDYLRPLQAPMGVTPILKCWMELN